MACVQAPQTAPMADEGGRSRSSSLEKQRRFLGRERYMGFHDEPLHRSESGGRPEQAQRTASGIPLDVRDEEPLHQNRTSPCAATPPDRLLTGRPSASLMFGALNPSAVGSVLQKVGSCAGSPGCVAGSAVHGF